MSFLIGCNYWASNAGTRMWVDWDEETVINDLKTLSGHGVRVMRVFPNWKHFQPVEPVLTGGGGIYEYRLEGDRIPENPYWLDEVMLARFDRFCDLCQEYNIKLIVGLLTGWMSGRLFVPAFLSEKDLYQDPTALLFEQRLVKGMVERFRHKEAIYAWDLGNECNCLKYSGAKEITTNWTGIIANAIKAADPTRKVVSGMHSVGVDDWGMDWTIKGQAEFCDVLTTHPYPMFVEHTYKDRVSSWRTNMHALCETKYYANLGNKPCFVEEVGLLGPTNADAETEVGFLRETMLSQYVNGIGEEFNGVLWWCNSDFTHLTNPPYTWKMEEVELGLMYSDKKPKHTLLEMKRMAEIFESFDFTLPKPKDDAVCVLTKGQKQWGNAFMTFCLAKQADLNISFAYAMYDIPESDTYIMPSISGGDIIPREKYLQILDRVEKGATLYISNDKGAIAEFTKVTGLVVRDYEITDEEKTFNFAGEDFTFNRSMHRFLYPDKAKVLADIDGEPVISEHSLGKGKVIYVNFPLEAMLLNKNNAFDGELYKIYKELFREKLSEHELLTNNKNLAKTLHYGENGEIYCSVINHSTETIVPDFTLKEGYGIGEVLYGNINEISKYDGAIFKIVKK